MILHKVVECRSKPQSVQNNNTFCMFDCFVLFSICFVFHFTQISSLIHCTVESCLEWGRAQISFLIPLKCCSLGFMLELCHNTLFYDTANLIWQLTATRQRNLPSSLPFLLALAMCLPALVSWQWYASNSPEGWLSGVNWQKNIPFFLLGILSGPQTGSEEGWVNTSFSRARQKREAEDTWGSPWSAAHPRALFCTHILSGSSTAH